MNIMRNLCFLVRGHEWHSHGSYLETLTLPNGEPNQWRRKYVQVLRCAKCGELTEAHQFETLGGGTWDRCELRKADEDDALASIAEKNLFY